MFLNLQIYCKHFPLLSLKIPEVDTFCPTQYRFELFHFCAVISVTLSTSGHHINLDPAHTCDACIVVPPQ